jgi:hypothetical protein
MHFVIANGKFFDAEKIQASTRRRNLLEQLTGTQEIQSGTKTRFANAKTHGTSLPCPESAVKYTSP